MPLDINIHKAKLENVNMGNEGSGDGQISRLDLKLVFTASSELLPTLVDVSEKDQNIFWIGGNLIGGLGLMELTKEWSHNKLQFGAIDSPFEESEETCLVAENVTVKNGKIKPMPENLIEVTLTAQIREPTPLQYKLCGNFQKREGGLVIKYDDSVARESSEDGEQKEAA